MKSDFVDWYLVDFVGQFQRAKKWAIRLGVVSCGLFALACGVSKGSISDALFGFFLSGYLTVFGQYAIFVAPDYLDIAKLLLRHPRLFFTVFVVCPLAPIWVIVANLSVAGFLQYATPGARSSPSPPAGFLAGLTHGWTSGVLLVFEVFGYPVRIFEPFNTGRFYDIGFFLGFLGLVAMWSKGAQKRDTLWKSDFPLDTGTLVEQQALAAPNVPSVEPIMSQGSSGDATDQCEPV